MCSRLAAETGSALVVDDDPSLIGFLSDNLPADRLQVLAAESAEDALRILGRVPADVALIDLALPGMSGLELIEAVRKGGPDDAWEPSMPILALSGRGDPHSPIRALRRGADDFLAKPFHYPELVARVEALLRRVRGMATGIVQIGPLVVDRRARRVTVNGEPVRLAGKEFALLAALARDPQRVLTKEELLRDVWGYIGRARTRTVDSHASRLRCKLAEHGAPGLVANVWGLGYRLLADA
jgi:DNA-binding response OmpR family regulator